MYLSSSEDDGLLAAVTAQSAPGSRFVGEYFGSQWQESGIPISSEDERAAWNQVRQAFRYGLAGTSPAAWLTRHGWKAGQTTTVTELARRGGRPVHYGFALASSPRVWLFDGTLG